MSRTVQITFDTEEQKREFSDYAAARGLSLSQFVKYACFVAKDKYRLGAHHPVKKAGRINAPLPTSDENPEMVAKADGRAS